MYGKKETYEEKGVTKKAKPMRMKRKKGGY